MLYTSNTPFIYGYEIALSNVSPEPFLITLTWSGQLIVTQRLNKTCATLSISVPLLPNQCRSCWLSVKVTPLIGLLIKTRAEHNDRFGFREWLVTGCLSKIKTEVLGKWGWWESGRIGFQSGMYRSIGRLSAAESLNGMKKNKRDCWLS